MAYQSEAQLEQQLIEQLTNQDYKQVTIEDYDALLENFKVQFEKYNESKLNGKPFSDKEWERIFNHISGKGIFIICKFPIHKEIVSRHIFACDCFTKICNLVYQPVF